MFVMDFIFVLFSNKKEYCESVCMEIMSYDSMFMLLLLFTVVKLFHQIARILSFANNQDIFQNR